MLDYRGQIAEATRRQHLLRQGRRHSHADPGLLPERHHRQTVIELAKRRGIEVIERAILPEELPASANASSTGSAAEVTPVSEIGPYRFTPVDDLRNADDDYMKEVYPAAIAAE